MPNRCSLLRVLLVALALLPLATPADAPEPSRPPRRLKVSVTEIKVLFSDTQVEALLSEVALTEASSFKRLETVERSDITGMLSFERQRQLLGCTEDAGCLAKIGGALGVDYLLLGTDGKIGTMYRIDLKLIDFDSAWAGLGRLLGSWLPSCPAASWDADVPIDAPLVVAGGEPYTVHDSGTSTWNGDMDSNWDGVTTVYGTPLQ